MAASGRLRLGAQRMRDIRAPSVGTIIDLLTTGVPPSARVHSSQVSVQTG